MTGKSTGKAPAKDGKAGCPDSDLPYRAVSSQMIKEMIGNKKNRYLGGVAFPGSSITLHDKIRKLPLYEAMGDFTDAYTDPGCRAMVVIGETGSGKTLVGTVVAAWEESGRTEAKAFQKVIVTQPRRLAAKSCAGTAARAMGVGLGQQVGYQTRGDSMYHTETQMLFVTDGILLNMLLRDRSLSLVATVIIDEAHERTVNTDLILGLLRETMRVREKATANVPALKVIIMSATIEAQLFTSLFPDTRLLRFGGRTYPVEILYSESKDADYLAEVVELVTHLHGEYQQGWKMERRDIIVFLTGVDEIRGIAKCLGKNDNLDIRQLHGKMSKAQQNQAVEASKRQRVFLSTEIAETSITLEGVTTVIDCGLSKSMRRDPRTGLEVLRTTQISKAQANQRAGRAGRTCPGRCFRLYTEQFFEREMPRYPVAAVQRERLTDAVLRIKAAGFQDMFRFPWLVAPAPDGLIRAAEELTALGFLDRDGKLTALGGSAATFPAEPCWLRACQTARELGCLRQMLAIAAVSSCRDSIHAVGEEADVAQQMREMFAYPLSDHITDMNFLFAFLAATDAKANTPMSAEDWCFVHGCNATALEEATVLYKLLSDWVAGKMGGRASEVISTMAVADAEYDTSLRKCLAKGLFFTSAVQDGERPDVYHSVSCKANGNIAPESVLVGIRPDWIVYSSYSKRQRPYYVRCTAVSADWIMDEEFFQRGDQYPRPEQGPGRFENQHLQGLLDHARKHREQYVSVSRMTR